MGPDGPAGLGWWRLALEAGDVGGQGGPAPRLGKIVQGATILVDTARGDRATQGSQNLIVRTALCHVGKKPARKRDCFTWKPHS